MKFGILCSHLCVSLKGPVVIAGRRHVHIDVMLLLLDILPISPKYFLRPESFFSVEAVIHKNHGANKEGE
jgi:hypothetical protein